MLGSEDKKNIKIQRFFFTLLPELRENFREYMTMSEGQTANVYHIVNTIFKQFYVIEVIQNFFCYFASVKAEVTRVEWSQLRRAYDTYILREPEVTDKAELWLGGGFIGERWGSGIE